MVQVYVSLIGKGLRTLDQVPEVWREDVRNQLEEQDEQLMHTAR